MKFLYYVLLLLSAAVTAEAQVVAEGLILDLDTDKGVEVEDGDRVVKWTNQVSTFSAPDFVMQDRDPPRRPTLAVLVPRFSMTHLGGTICR